MDPTGAWQEIINQGPLFAFMAIALWVVVKFGKSLMDKSDKREDEREARYNQLMDKLVIVQTEQVVTVTAALTACTAVMERVERKLDASDHR